MFEEGKSNIIYTAKYDGNCDKGAIYLGVSRMGRQDELRAEHKTHSTEDCYMYGKLLDGTDCKILLETAASKSHMSKTFYLNCQSLLSLLKLASRTKKFLVGSVQYISVLFVIPVVINLLEHRLEIYTSVSEIHGNVDMVLGNKNVYEVEEVINTSTSFLFFLKNSLFSFQTWKYF